MAKCGSNPRLDADPNPDPQEGTTESTGQFFQSCGNSSPIAVDFRIRTPAQWSGNLFAILFNGTPGTWYFGDTGGQSQVVVRGLLAQGYRVLDFKYAPSPRIWDGHIPMYGFYSVCFGQGINSIIAHNASLYDALVSRLEYSPSHSAHRLIGFGASLGGTQVESMAFFSGEKFKKVGITGVLLGDAARGCAQGRTQSYSGSWKRPTSS